MQLQNNSKKPSSWKCYSALLIALILLPCSMGLVSHGAEPTSPAIARDIADIQRQLGGSIVEGRQLLAPRPTQPGWAHHPQQPRPPYAQKPPLSPTEQKIELLRKAAAQLDAVASQLEFADLYSDADNLREMAHGFRRDARKLRRK